MRCDDSGNMVEDSGWSQIGNWPLILAPLVLMAPAFLAGWLVHYRQHDYFDRKYPEGRVTAENIKPEGETIGERLSQLDDKWHLAAFGFF